MFLGFSVGFFKTGSFSLNNHDPHNVLLTNTKQYFDANSAEPDQAAQRETV